MPFIFILILCFFAYQYFFGENSGCERYASKYSCEYVEKKATYSVYYWIRVQDDNPRNERYVGSATGLSNCRDQAIYYSRRNNDNWTERSYICVLMKDGKAMEKHRL
jgi:hypothetical protein